MAIDASEQIEKFQDFIEQHYQKDLHERLNRGITYIVFDFFKLAEYDPRLADQLLEEPEETLKAAELALEQFEVKKGFRVRFSDLPKSQEIFIRNIRSKHLKKFIACEGIIRQSSEVRPQVVTAKFECPSCGNTITMPQIDQQFREPSRCTCGRKGKFRLLDKDLVDVQRLVIEESPENLEGGAQPKRLQVFLREDLVEPRMEKRTTPGTRVVVNGVVFEIPIQTRTGATSTRFDIAMHANFIDPVEEDFSEIQVSVEDEKEIQKLAKDKKIYTRLIASVSPSIYGHDKIKEAILLQMFGGVRKIKKDKTKVRGDLHILLVGDPGAGKSQMLTFVHATAPKARYVAGRSTSGAGITASVVKDEFLKGWALEAGAMVLADKGTLVLDEMDKMSVEDTSALHQAMEQQEITISKANIQACYSEDTEVLTNEGWKKYLEVKNKKIAQYDPEKETIEFLPHRGLFVYNYNKKMYHFKNKRNDILVTPNHKMLFKEMRHKDYQFLPAEEIPYSRIKFLNSGNFIGNKIDMFNLPSIKHKQNRKHPKYVHQENIKKIPMDLWLEFLGYFVTEGGLQGGSSFGIPQKDKKNVDLIRKCLIKLSKYVGFTLSETKEGPYTRFQITNTQLFKYLKENCGKSCIEKRFPLDISLLSKKQLKILYDAMMLGDGSSDDKSYSSTSIELINMFQAVAMLVGKSASMHVQYKEGTRGKRVTLYRVCLSDRTEPSIKMNQVEKVKYKGKVYCFSTKTGFFLTRRNGKIAIQGNTLRTQTSILAAANPKFGRFDPFTPIPQQIDMPPALINRFDLIFVLRDLPDKELDSKIASAVLAYHAYEDAEPEIPSTMLRKYLAYAKQKIFPKLGKEASDEIKDFYVQLRSAGQMGDDSGIKAIPISARQLEAIVRLAEASARIRLSETIDTQDVRRAIGLVKHCLTEVGMDPETGQIDIDRMSTGITASTRGKILLVRDIIFDLCDSKEGAVSIDDDLKPRVFEKGVTEQKLDEAISKLKRSGDIFEPKKGYVQKI
ncbi:MAG: ATP-binding protein [archaeon]